MGYTYKGTIHDLDAPLLTLVPEPKKAPAKPSTGCGDRYGTTAGYKRHQKAGEEACAACKTAVAAYAAEYRARVRSGEHVVRTGFSTDRCGTHAGYWHHGRQGVPVCDPCNSAYRAYMAGYRATRKAAA